MDTVIIVGNTNDICCKLTKYYIYFEINLNKIIIQHELR